MTENRILSCVNAEYKICKPVEFTNKCRDCGGCVKNNCEESDQENEIQVNSHQSITAIYESRILVLYTGGTIGMIPLGENGPLAPGHNMFEKEIRLFSDLHDPTYVEKRFGKNSRYLALPKSPEKNRIIYLIEEFAPLLDSSNMSVKDWEKIAQSIEENYQCYDGFVVLHGTDTLTYTSAALSFMLENLGKPVIVTGAQISVFGSRSDGRANFTSSLIMAGNFQIPEVVVLFQDKLIRGNRVCKLSTNKFHAFQSLRIPPLAEIGIAINVDWKSIFRPFGIEKFRINKNFNTNVGLLRLHPNINAAVVRASLQPPIQGVVLETYGAGNMPSDRQDILDELRSGVESGVLIVNITQCPDGCVDTIYETGQVLSEIGVILGADMTTEAAYTKLCYVLSKDGWSYQKRKEMMLKNLRGELEVKGTDEDLLAVIAQNLGCTTTKDINELKTWLEPALLSRAIFANDIAALDSLRLSKCNLSATNTDGRTPLHIACAENKIDIVRYLLEYGANVHIKDNFNRTPLFDAIQKGFIEIVKLLVECGAHVSLCPFELGESLSFAAANGCLDILKSFRIAGADLNTQDISGRTPLHLACLHNYPEMVRYLLRDGCKVNVYDKLGITPLQIVQKMELMEIEYIIKRFIHDDVCCLGCSSM